MIVGVSSGAAVGAASSLALPGRHKAEAAIRGAVLGGVIGGLAGYLIHGALEDRDESVRHDTLMNLEHYDVLGVDHTKIKPISAKTHKCLTTRVVDGRLVTIPCELASDSSEIFN